MHTVLVHILGEDPVLGEIDELPAPGDTLITMKHPRRRDGKDIHYLEANVDTVMWPVNRLAFIEIIPSEEEDEIIGFVRE